VLYSSELIKHYHNASVTVQALRTAAPTKIYLLTYLLTTVTMTLILTTV